MNSIASVRLPSEVGDLTPELLTALLSARHPTIQVKSVEVLSTAECGDGLASTADRVSLKLSYAPGTDASLPERYLLKTMLLHPHAPEAMYRNEVRFYSEIREEIDIEAPRSYATAFDEETGRFGILMEDLSLRSVRFPNATTLIKREEIEGLVDTLARLHASYWQSERFGSALDWLATPCSGGMYPIFKGIGLELIKDQVEKNPFKQELIAPLERSLDELWGDLWKAQKILSGEPTTLLHGDPHIGNTYLLPDGSGGFLDWQLMVRGGWSHDFTYLLITGLSIENRRKWEDELLARYLDRLFARGVPNPPDRDDAWMLYRQSAIWGLVIGWLITPPTNYGEAITRANLERLVAAVQDLESVAALA